jgi:hypothetical protein
MKLLQHSGSNPVGRARFLNSLPNHSLLAKVLTTPKDYFICKTLSALPSAKICRAATPAAALTLIIIGLRLAGGAFAPRSRRIRRIHDGHRLQSCLYLVAALVAAAR